MVSLRTERGRNDSARGARWMLAMFMHRVTNFRRSTTLYLANRSLRRDKDGDRVREALALWVAVAARFQYGRAGGCS
jgi:hypothetical protein